MKIERILFLKNNKKDSIEYLNIQFLLKIEFL
jgi:hypothetical protein